MSNPIALLPLAAPLAFCGASLLSPSRPGVPVASALRVTTVASFVGLLVAGLMAVSVYVLGPHTSTLLGTAGVGLSVRVDAFSAVLAALIAVIGAVVLRFSRHYMAGDPRQADFLSRMTFTLAAVWLLVLSGNLTQLIFAWMMSSVGLQRLLTFYRGRPRGWAAARKKFLMARGSDICLILASVLLVATFGTTDLVQLGTLSAEGVPNGSQVPFRAAGYLIALAAALKCAQYPFQSWLPASMETPTPVSALLHAGIINAGGFLVIRLADVMVAHGQALQVLAVIGGASAVLGSLTMLTQPSIKGTLAYSTIAQMGLMLFQCGVGAFRLAALHLVAHSLYKAHAFLSSGGAVQLATRPRADGPPLTASRVGAKVAFFVALSLGGALALTRIPMPAPEFACLIVVWFALCGGLAEGAGGPSFLRSLAAHAAKAPLLLLAYLGSKYAIAFVVGGAVPQVADMSLATQIIAYGFAAAVAGVGLLQLCLPLFEHTAIAQAVSLHLRNGLYLDALLDRLVGGLGRGPAQHPLNTETLS